MQIRQDSRIEEESMDQSQKKGRVDRCMLNFLHP
jgi:hypothetical protein